jgi:hypothetical protein
MIYLKCPVCGEHAPLDTMVYPVDDERGLVAFREDSDIEAFVHEHLGHLGEDDILLVVESAGDC